MLNKSVLIIVFLLSAVGGGSAQVAKPCENADYGLRCVEQELDLLGSEITIKTYTKTKPNKIIDRTFVVVHANEEKGLDAAKQAVAENYGRLVEVVSNYQDGFHVRDALNKRRYLYFGDGQFCVDPNRIYTKVGIGKNLSDCDAIPSDKIDEIFAFGQKLIKIITADNTHKFIIGVHNNGDTALSLESWSGARDAAKSAVGIFQANDHESGGVIETGNFILVSNVGLFVKLFGLETSFNIALQENRKYLVESGGANRGKIKANLDDGSMSIYFGATLFKNTGKPFDYMNIEAEGKDKGDGTGGYKQRQKKAIELVITKIRLGI